MEPEKQADMLLVLTVVVFLFLTLVAFLMNEGKDMVLRPIYHKVRGTCCSGKQRSHDISG